MIYVIWMYIVLFQTLILLRIVCVCVFWFHITKHILIRVRLYGVFGSNVFIKQLFYHKFREFQFRVCLHVKK